MFGKAYFTDSYIRDFTAEVVEELVMDGHPAVVLEATYFYPMSGGQPADAGRINNINVLDVFMRAEDGAVVHLLERGLDSKLAHGQIDWSRRFDHMQQHTGQHILSQSFIQIAHADTVGFHLSDTSVTIDLQTDELSAEDIDKAERLANDLVWQNRAVNIREVSLEGAGKLRLRKIPPIQNGKLRLIDITDFDLTPCGGTHVARTGEVGLIKLIKQERRGDKQRIEFCCGQRALNIFKEDHEIISTLMSRLTTGSADLDAAVEKLQEENKLARRQLKEQQSELSRLEASVLVDEAVRDGRVKIIARTFSDRDQGQIRSLASELILHDGVIALLGLAGGRSHLIFGRSATARGDMASLLKKALQVLGSNSGGGNETFAQGVGHSANTELVQQAILSAKVQLIEEIADID